MYAEKINTNSYLYYRSLLVTNSFTATKNNVQIRLFLNSSNFNFDLVREDGKDIRFSEISNGDQALHYWIAEWNYQYKKATIWLLVPSLHLSESKTIFVFFGNQYDTGNSNYTELNLPFLYLFKSTPLDSIYWGGTITKSYTSSKGYSVNDGANFYTITSPLNGLSSWEVHVGLYADTINTDDYDLVITLTGGENPISMRFDYATTSISLRTTTEIHYTQQGAYIEQNSYNELSIWYDDDLDIATFSLLNKDTLPDFTVSSERMVEGNTTATDLSIYRYDAGTFGVYFRWVLIKELTTSKIQIDYSDLYVDLSATIGDLSWSATLYTSDMTSNLFYHYSNCGGNPYLLTNNLLSSNSWNSSTLDTNYGEIIIDFARHPDNMVSSTYLHYDSGHLPFYNASKLSDSDSDKFNRNYWQGKATTGWACIDYNTSYKKISCLGILAREGALNGMVRGFSFQGGYGDPRKSSSSWVTLYMGICSKTTGWQQFYFVNDNFYRYYKLNILSTFGDNICLQEWNMYETYTENLDGIIINQVKLLPYVGDSSASFFPKKFSLKASNDFVSWDVVLPEVQTYTPYIASSVSGYWQHYIATSPDFYRAYKFCFTDNWGGSNNRFVISEIEMAQYLEESLTLRTLPTVYRRYYNRHHFDLGKFWSLYFDGAGGMVSMGNLLTIGTSSFTIELMIYIPIFSNPSGWSSILTNLDSSSNYRFDLQIKTNGVISFYTQSSTSNYTVSTPYNSYSLNTWHRFSFVRSAGIGYIYVDGVLRGSGAVNSDDIGKDTTWVLGGKTVTTACSICYIYDVRLWSVAREQSDISDDIYTIPTLITQDVVTYFPITEGAGTTIEDAIEATVGALNNQVSWVYFDYTLCNSDTQQIIAKSTTSFDQGWLYLSMEGCLIKFYDYKLSSIEYPLSATGYRFMKRLFIDKSSIGENLTYFPLLINLCESSGVDGQDVTDIFNEIGNDYKKIKIVSGGIQLYVLVEYWNAQNKKAVLWTSSDQWVLSSTEDTNLFFYYDSQAEDNDTFVNLIGENSVVWDEYTNLYYSMRDVIDASANKYDGNLSSSLTTGNSFGVVDIATLFNGTTANYISVNKGAINSLYSFTISCWIKTLKTGAQAIISASRTGSIDELVFYLASSTVLTPYLKNSALPSTTIPSVSDGNWHFLSWSRDTSIGTCHLYIDTVLTTISGVTTSQLLVNTGGVIIGQEQDSVGGGFSATQALSGSLDMFKISTTCRSDAWVRAEYLSQKDSLIYFINNDVLNDILVE